MGIATYLFHFYLQYICSCCFVQRIVYVLLCVLCMWYLFLCESTELPGIFGLKINLLLLLLLMFQSLKNVDGRSFTLTKCQSVHYFHTKIHIFTNSTVANTDNSQGCSFISHTLRGSPGGLWLGLNIFYSGRRYTEKERVQLKVRHYPLKRQPTHVSLIT